MAGAFLLVDLLAVVLLLDVMAGAFLLVDLLAVVLLLLDVLLTVVLLLLTVVLAVDLLLEDLFVGAFLLVTDLFFLLKGQCLLVMSVWVVEPQCLHEVLFFRFRRPSASRPVFIAFARSSSPDLLLSCVFGSSYILDLHKFIEARFTTRFVVEALVVNDVNTNSSTINTGALHVVTALEVVVRKI